MCAVGVQACDWTGDCPVEGCQNRCQLFPSSVGALFVPLEDRAFDLDWWQLCPDLAQRVGFYRESDLAANAPSPAYDDSVVGPRSGIVSSSAGHLHLVKITSHS